MCIVYRKKIHRYNFSYETADNLSPETIPVVMILIICSNCMTGSIRIWYVSDQYFYAIHDMNSTATFESDFNLTMTCADQIPRQNNQGRWLTLDRYIGLHNHKLWKVISRYELFCFDVSMYQKTKSLQSTNSHHLTTRSLNPGMTDTASKFTCLEFSSGPS